MSTNRERAHSLRATGLSFRAIGAELGISGEAARKLLLPVGLVPLGRPRTCPHGKTARTCSFCANERKKKSKMNGRMK